MAKRITKKQKKEWLNIVIDEGCITWTGCDDAIVGIGQRLGSQPVVIYDEELLIKVFVDNGMTYQEAQEWVDVNIINSYVGEQTPIVMNRCPW